MTATDPQDLERAIDSVARRLTSGDPPAHLRARALARLDERRSPPWIRVTAAVCAVGVVVAAVAIGLHDRAASPVAPDLQASAGKPSSNKSLAATTQIQTPSLKPQAASLPPSHVRREPRITASAPSAEELAWRARAIPALEQPNPLTIDEIQPAPLEVRPLVTTPLTVPAIGDEDGNGHEALAPGHE